MNRQLKVCWWLGAVPLATGLTILFLIWLYEWDWLFTAGKWTLLATGIFLPAGFVVAVVWAILILRDEKDDAVPVFRPLAALLGFYAVVVVAANMSVGGAIMCTSRYELIVRNDTQQPMQQVRATCNGLAVWLGQIDPGQAKRRLFWIPDRGPLTLHGAHMGQNFATVVDDEASSNGWRQTANVTLGQDGILRALSRCDEHTDRKAIPIHPLMVQQAAGAGDSTMPAASSQPRR